MLFRTNVLAVVSGGSRPKFADNVLLIYDDFLKKFILDITFPSSIRAVRMRRDKYVLFCNNDNYWIWQFKIFRLIVALLNQIHVFSFPTPTQRLFTLETKENYRGLCEVSHLASAEKQILVFPGHKIGSVQLVVWIVYLFLLFS